MLRLDRVLTSEPPGELRFREPGSGKYETPIQAIFRQELLLVVGDPGGGKTFLVDAVSSLLDNQGVSTHVVNLLAVSESTIQRIIQGLSDTPGAGGVLFLDGLDESRAAMTSLVADIGFLIEAAQNLKIRVVATCRSAEINESIKRLFDLPKDPKRADSVSGRVMYLAPLARSDVEGACKAAGIDAAKFLEETLIAGVEDLASSPYTLDLLIERSQALGTLAADRTELYEATVTRLLKRMKPLRSQAARTPGASDKARRDFAGQLALTLALSRSRTIAVEDGGGRASLHGSFPVGNPFTEYSATEWQRAMEEVLESGLLVRVSEGELAFSHRSLLDYLAADRLVVLRLDNKLERQLLTLPGTPDLLPLELLPVARWLITMSTRFDWVASVEPLRLVQARAQDEVARLRPILVDSLIRDAARWDYSAPYSTSFSGLQCPELSGLVRAALLTGSAVQRSMALRILIGNPASELTPEVIALARDSSVDGHVRQLAVDTLQTLGDREALSEIAEGLLQNSLELGEGTRGAVLSACWPDVLTTSDMLSLLVPPRASMFGRYKLFLMEMTSRANPDDLAEIATWAAAMTLRDSPSRRRDSHVRTWSQRILLDALEKLEKPAALSFDEAEVARILLATQGGEKSLDLGLKRLAPEARQSIILLSMRDALALGMPWYEVLGFVEDGVNVVTEIDFVRLLELATGDSPEFAEIATRVFDPLSPDHRQAIGSFAMTPLGQTLKQRLEPQPSVGDESRRPTRLRSRDLAVPRKSLSSNDLLDRLRSELAQTAADIRRFWVPFFVLTAEPESGRFRDMAGEDYTGFELYGSLSRLDKVRIRKLAERFLREVSPDVLPPHDDQSSHSRVHHAAYQILYVAFVQGWSVIAEMPDQSWRSLVDSVIRFPVHYVNGPRDADTKRLLLESLFERVPDAFLGRVRDFVDMTVADPSKPVSLRDVAGIPDARIAHELHRLVDVLNEHERAEVVSALITASPRSDFASELLLTGPAPDVSAAIKAYLSLDPKDGTAKLIEVVGSRPEISVAVLQAVAVGERFSRSLHGNVAQLLALSRAMFAAFPPDEDPAQGPGGYTVTPRHDAADLRRHFVDTIVSIGTRESFDAMLHLSVEAPSMVSSWDLHRASEAYKANGWPGTEPRDLEQALVEKKTGVLARDADELLENLLTVLAEISEDLGPPNQLGRYLWNEQSHKSESDVSDWYQHELRLRLKGAFINREVLISGKKLGSIGDRADIQVDAIAPGSANHTVVVEVKGSWHRNVLSAINNQLVAQYLVSRNLTHGIFLVAWFDPGATPASRRPSKAEKMTPSALGLLLAAQAGHVEPPLRVAAVVHEVPIG